MARLHDILIVMYLTCDACGQWGHKDSAHQYEMIDGEIICEKCQIAGLTNTAKLGEGISHVC